MVLQLCYTCPVLTTQLQQHSTVSTLARVRALTNFAYATCSRAAQGLPGSGDTSRDIVTRYVAVASCLALGLFLLCVMTSPACRLADPNFDIERDCCIFLFCCTHHVILQAWSATTKESATWAVLAQPVHVCLYPVSEDATKPALIV